MVAQAPEGPEHAVEVGLVDDALVVDVVALELLAERPDLGAELRRALGRGPRRVEQHVLVPVEGVAEQAHRNCPAHGLPRFPMQQQ